MKRRLSGGVTSRQKASNHYPLMLDACLECTGQFVLWENISFSQLSPNKSLGFPNTFIRLYLRNRKLKDLCLLMLSLIWRTLYICACVCVCVCACLRVSHKHDTVFTVLSFAILRPTFEYPVRLFFVRNISTCAYVILFLIQATFI